MKSNLSNAAPAANRREPALKIEAKKRSWLCPLAYGVLGIGALALTVETASAQTAANADTVFNGFLSAYLVTVQPPGGYNYALPYIRGSTTNVKQFAMWEEGYLIGGIEDAYDSTAASDRKDLVEQLVTAYIANYGPELQSGWNDDIEWGTRTLAHGYQITGDSAFLDAAILNWNKVWDRGWNTDLGGGILEKQDASSKCVLSNGPFIIAGCMLYSSTGDSVYLDRSKQDYAWMRSTCFNTSTGQVIEGVASGGPLNSDNTYNSGLLIEAANALYQLTGDSQYYNDAVLAINHQKSEHNIFTSDNGAEEFFRGLSLFARINNLWATYYPWLQANAQAAWDHRRTDYNITWEDFSSTTTTDNLKSMKALNSLIVQQVTAIRPVGQFELRNTASSLSLSVAGNSTANGAGIIQSLHNGGGNQLWTFAPNSDNGYCQIINVASGKDLAVQSASTANGAAIIQWSFGSAGNDQWAPALTIRGNYTLINKRSGKTLEDPGSSTTQGVQMDQGSYTGNSNQGWQLIPQIYLRTDQLAVASSSSGVTHRVLVDPAYVGGAGTILDATAVGNYVTYLIPNISAGSYDVRVGVKDFSSRGIWQMAAGRADNFTATKSNVGAATDEYATGTVITEVDLGTWTPGITGDKWFRFMITGKNANSSGYTESFNYIELIPQ